MPTPQATVQFKAGLQTNFDAIQSKDLNTVYFVTDTQRLFVGETEYTRPVQHGATLPTGYLPPNSLFVKETGAVRDLYYSADGAAWTQIAHLPASITGGVFGSATKVPKITVDERGAITAVEDVDIQFPAVDTDVTVTGNDAAGNVITGVSASGRTITVTKGTVLDETAGDKRYAQLSGATFTGDVKLPTKPAGNTSAVTKSYVDGQISTVAAGAKNTATVTGEGNAITTASFDDAGHTLTLTKGATFATKAQLDAVETKADQGITDAAGALAEAQAKVASVKAGNTGITIDGTATEPTVAVKVSTQTGNVLKIDETNGGLFVPTPAAATVTGIKEGEKVLSLTGTELGTTLSLNYKNTETEKKIQLLGIDNALVGEIDATAFIKDGMLDSAELKVATAENPVGTHTSGTFLVLTFNTDAGKEEIDIDVSSLIDTYTADPNGGLSLTDHAFSIKKDPNSEGFLSVGATGLKISGVQTAIDTAKDAVLGTSDDASTEATVYGARALATEANTAASNAASAAGKVNLVQSATDGHVLTFTNSAGTSTEITIPDATLKWGSF